MKLVSRSPLDEAAAMRALDARRGGWQSMDEEDQAALAAARPIPERLTEDECLRVTVAMALASLARAARAVPF